MIFFFFLKGWIKEFQVSSFKWSDVNDCVGKAGQKSVTGWIVLMRCLNWTSATSVMSMQHEWEIWLRSNASWIKIHPLIGFLSSDVFLTLLPLTFFSFEILFHYSKSSGNLITASKMLNITNPSCPSKHPWWCHNG